jgi:hypothetical protein
MKLKIDPKGYIKKGKRFKVDVSYAGTPEAIVDADTALDGWIPACAPAPLDVCDGAFVVNEPIGAQSWFPSNNYPTDKATFKTSITVPSTHVAFGAGELAKQTEDGDDTTWVWKEDDPTATYLTTGTVGLFDYEESEMTEDSTGEDIQIYTGIDSAGTPLAKMGVQESFDRIPEQSNYLSDKLGPYPFDSTGGVADWAPNVGYALENQTKPHYDGNDAGPSVNIYTQLHELAHQWMGDSISPNTWLEIWFNEGWATFLTVYWDWESEGGPPPEDFFADVYSQPAEYWELAPADLDGDPANLFAGPVYDRSGAMIEGYREIVGDEIFWAFAQELNETYGYATISTDQFTKLAVKRSGLTGSDKQLLKDYFEQWLYGTTKPTITPASFE